MTLYILGALLLWLIAGVVVGFIIAPTLSHRASEDELMLHSMQQDVRGE